MEHDRFVNRITLNTFLYNHWFVFVLVYFSYLLIVARYLDTDFASKVQSKKPLGDIHDAILAYSKNMGAGKVLFI